jgi:lambda repressor-like predicted transcriptional regulator
MIRTLTNQENIQQLLRIQAERGVPLDLNIPFLLKLAGWGIEETATQAGFTRTHFYLALRGDRTPQRKLRQLLAQRLGQDPWDVYGA